MEMIGRSHARSRGQSRAVTRTRRAEGAGPTKVHKECNSTAAKTSMPGKQPPGASRRSKRQSIEHGPVASGDPATAAAKPKS